MREEMIERDVRGQREEMEQGKKRCCEGMKWGKKGYAAWRAREQGFGAFV